MEAKRVDQKGHGTIEYLLLRKGLYRPERTCRSSAGRFRETPRAIVSNVVLLSPMSYGDCCAILRVDAMTFGTDSRDGWVIFQSRGFLCSTPLFERLLMYCSMIQAPSAVDYVVHKALLSRKHDARHAPEK